MALKMLKAARIVFWDFDGVIKESVGVKSEAFSKLFSFCDSEIIQKIQKHHLNHGGMSRFEKIPLYLNWSGQRNSSIRVDEFCQRFGELVVESVIESQWVPGVESYIRKNPYLQKFFLVTATPQREIEYILDSIELRSCFLSIWGAPVKKHDAIATALKMANVDASECVMIGDSSTDLEAAQINEMPFIYRRSPSNLEDFFDYKGPFLENFIGL